MEAQLNMHWHAFSIFLASLFMLLCGLVALLRKNQLGFAFSLLCLCFAIWFGGMSLNYFMVSDPLTESWNRFFYVGICFIPACFYYVTASFFRLNKKTICYWCLTFFLISLFFSILSQFHNQFINGTTNIYYSYSATYGPIGFLFILYTLSVVAISLFLWYRGFRAETNSIHRQRLKIIFLTFALSSLALVDFLPTLGIPVYPFGYIIVTLFIGFQTYAVFVFRLTKIQNLILVTVHHCIIIVLLAIPWFILTLVVIPAQPSWKLSWFLSVVAFALFVPYVIHGFPFLESILFKKDAVYQNIVQAFLDEIVILQQPEKLVHKLQSLLSKTLRIPRVCIITKRIERGKYYYWDDHMDPQDCPPEASALFSWLITHPDILFKYDIEYDPKYSSVQPIAEAAFNRLEAELFIPIVQANNFLGLIVLGRKFDQLPLRPIEFRFLSLLQPFASIAMNNSALYEHIRFLSIDLMNVNETLNDKVQQRSAELEEALAHMKKMNQEQSNFFNMASHHLRTPLTSIKAAATLLWAKYPTEKKTGLNAILMENIRRLETLIRNIIEIAKMENGRMNIRFNQIHIQKLILKAYLELEVLFKEKNLKWAFTLDDAIQVIHADPARLKTVLSNLFSNAFKYTPKGGQVTVHLTRVSKENLQQRYDFGGRPGTEFYYEFSVRDTGEGIPQEEQQRIFNIFHQVTDSHKRYQGPGLGLYLVKKIIENHNGLLKLESTPGRGSVFSFILPVV